MAASDNMRKISTGLTGHSFLDRDESVAEGPGDGNR